MTEIELSFFVLFCQTPLIITLFLFLYKTWIGVDFFVKNLRTAKTIKMIQKVMVFIYFFLLLNHFFILVVSSPLVSSILARLASAIAINRCNICRNCITCKKMNNHYNTVSTPSCVMRVGSDTFGDPIFQEGLHN